MTIMNMVRSMLKGINLSNEYWAEAVACAIYVINISPTKSVMNKVTEQAWSGMSCSVSHLRVFGCVAYEHVPKDRRGKLDDKSENAYLLVIMSNQNLINCITLSPRRP